MENLRHFQTILAAGGMFYVASDNRIYAFAF
jgi:tRNA G46 methylase TrmB